MCPKPFDGDLMEELAKLGMPSTDRIEVFKHEEYGGYGIRATQDMVGEFKDGTEHQEYKTERVQMPDGTWTVGMFTRDRTDPGGLELSQIKTQLLNVKYIEVSDKWEHTRTKELWRLMDVDGQSTRKSVESLKMRLMLLVQMVNSWGCSDGEKETIESKFYLDKGYPDHVPLPTTWEEVEINFLRGTSLFENVIAKARVLRKEFMKLKQVTEDNRWWCEKLWNRSDGENLTLEDWRRVDSWYRSRAVTTEDGKPAMAAFLDLVNHSAKPNAQYKFFGMKLFLMLNPGAKVRKGEEITISYDAAGSSIAEILNSYGFVEKNADFSFLTKQTAQKAEYPLNEDYYRKLILPGNEEREACYRQHHGAPRIKVIGMVNKARVESPFLNLLFLQSADGLEIKSVASKKGLYAFYNSQDITDKLDDHKFMNELLMDSKNHRACRMQERKKYYKLLMDILVDQAQELQEGEDYAASWDPEEESEQHQQIYASCTTLRKIEAKLIDNCLSFLEEETEKMIGHWCPEDCEPVAYKPKVYTPPKVKTKDDFKFSMPKETRQTEWNDDLTYAENVLRLGVETFEDATNIDRLVQEHIRVTDLDPKDPQVDKVDMVRLIRQGLAMRKK